MIVRFRQFIGFVDISKSLCSTGRGCSYGSNPFQSTLIELSDYAKPPDERASPGNLIIKVAREINFDEWVIVHEFGHAWDINYDWRFSEVLEDFTHGYTNPNLHPEYCQNDQTNGLRGCIVAGYFYGGIPPKCSDINFKRGEDFAESVFFVEVHRRVQEYSILEEPYRSNLFYSDFTKTRRWEFINGLISGEIQS